MLGLSSFANLFGFCVRRSVCDSEMFGLLGTQGRIQGRTLGVSGGT